MPLDPLLVRARHTWETVAGAPGAFGSVVVAPGSRMCPPGWVGLVTLGGAALVTVPSTVDRERFVAATAGWPVAELTRPVALAAVLPVRETLGPATLAYRSVPGGAADPVERLPAGSLDLAALLGAVPEAEADESGLAGTDSPTFVVRSAGAVVAASAYDLWPAQTAHLCVLTHPDHRQRGLARVVAAAATEHAQAAGLLPQWRARPVASRRLARSLGFRELGEQFSLRLAAS